MAVCRLFNLAYIKCLFTLALVLSLVACSGGGGGSSDPGSTGLSDISTGVNILGLSWKPPVEREDFTPLALGEIRGYNIYYGAETGNYNPEPVYIDDDDNATFVQAEITDIPSGTYYVVVTTVDTDGRESVHSSESEVEVTP